jgi:hypothetical protein
MVSKKEKSFSATVEIIIGNPHVALPMKVLDQIFKQSGRNKGPIPVKGILNGIPYKQTLVRYDGDWRLYLNGIMLKQSGVWGKSEKIISVVGKKVKIHVEYDGEPREISMDKSMASALSKDKIASEAFNNLAPYRKHEIMRYLGFLKTETAINKNVERIIKHLRGEETDALYPLMHRKKVE